jgi:long-chain acyl-CoA synthetase
MLSGGSALPPALSKVLSTHFGVPVGQGYGLAETSPSTHFERLDHPKPGSCGVLVPGTECRIVDVATALVVPAGELGEIQVRGPQLMRGYLGADTPATDPDGWFATGDVGYLDEDGYLFLVDRIKDVFKCDNFLVAPTAIERVAVEHPQVAECVVVDRPDPVHGAVACALVVPAHPGADADKIAADVNDKLPYYEHLHSVTLLERIPRSVNGKISRRDLRSLVSSGPSRQPVERTTTMVTFINRLTVTGSVDEFEELLDGITEYMTTQPGFRSRRLYRSASNPQVFIEVAEWSDPDAHSAAMRNPAFGERVGKLRALATAEPDIFATVSEKVTA